MIECVFTVDYELYGNGQGTLAELVYRPAETLRELFCKAGCRFVLFVEAAELEMIDTVKADLDIDAVKQQMRALRSQGFEIGLHIHPWWYGATHDNGCWQLDYSEYNMCGLAPTRIAQMVDRALAFLRSALRAPDFSPLVFRAGHHLLQPAAAVVHALSARGIKIDSSVYKGGVWDRYQLDYRPALKNGHFWRFSRDPNVVDPAGPLLELPVHTVMAPAWSMLTSKRLALQRKAAVAHAPAAVLSRVRAAARLRRAVKFDFCAMTRIEMKRIIDAILREDRADPGSLRPVVTIGHTKDLIDSDAVAWLLDYLQDSGIRISTFADLYQRALDATQYREGVVA